MRRDSHDRLVVPMLRVGCRLCSPGPTQEQRQKGADGRKNWLVSVHRSTRACDLVESVRA